MGRFLALPRSYYLWMGCRLMLWRRASSAWDRSNSRIFYASGASVEVTFPNVVRGSPAEVGSSSLAPESSVDKRFIREI
jgi:hypothetical protein